MAFSASTIWECQQAGGPTNGAGFDPANASMATDLAATLATSTAPVVTSASYNFDNTRDAGKYLFVKAGTNWTPGWYPIASCAGNAATLDAAIGAAVLSGGATVLNTVAGCATTASPTSGTWSVDYSRGTSAGIAYTDMAIDGTTSTKYTSAGNPVGPNVIGNVISVNSGTGFTVQRVQVSSVATITATCDKSLGTLSSTGGNGNLGGATDGPATIAGVVVAGNTMFIKYGATPYAMGASSNVSGGLVNCSIASGLWQGYDTTRAAFNSDANRPILRCNADSITQFQVTNAQVACNLSLDNPAAHTALIAARHNGKGYFLRCKSDGATSRAFDLEGDGSGIIDCVVTGYNNSGGHAVLLQANGSYAARSAIVAPTCASGFRLAADGTFLDECTVSGAATSNNNGVILAGNSCVIRRCVVSGGAGNGVAMSDASTADGCIVHGNSLYGFAMSVATATTRLVACAGGGNTSGNYQNTFRADQVTNFQALTASPFANAGSLDFSLNTTAGAGAACRGPSVALPGLSTTSYPDIGAAQHQASGGGYRPRPRTGGN